MKYLCDRRAESPNPDGVCKLVAPEVEHDMRLPVEAEALLVAVLAGELASCTVFDGSKPR